MMKKTYLAALILPVAAFNAAALDLKKADAETFAYLLNEKLNAQKVIISAPGIPSRVHEMSMVAEDPEHENNKGKAYHPAEISGWGMMVRQGRLLEKNGLMVLEAGTFEEKSYTGEDFTFSGYLMKFTDRAREYLAVMPAIGRVGLKIGSVGVDEITEIGKTVPLNGRAQLDVSFTTKLINPAPWASEEILRETNINSFVEGSLKVRMSFDDGQWRIADEDFLLSVKNPVFDFE